MIKSPAGRLRSQPVAVGTASLLGEKDGVDDVNDPVRGLDVSLGDVRVVDHDLATLRHDLHAFAVDGFGVVHLDDILGEHFSGDYVIGEDRDEFLFVLRLEQFVDGSGRQFGEGFIGGSEDSEWAGALERIHQAGGREGSGQGGEITRRSGGVNDVFIRIRPRRSWRAAMRRALREMCASLGNLRL